MGLELLVQDAVVLKVKNVLLKLQNKWLIKIIRL